MPREIPLPEVTTEKIEQFLQGHDPMERIVNIEIGYNDNFATIFYKDRHGKRCVMKQNYYPFLWAKRSTCRRWCNGDRGKVKSLIAKYGIKFKSLRTTNAKGEEPERMRDGYTILVSSDFPMTYSKFMDFFADAGVPVYKERKEGENVIPENKEDSRPYLNLTPVEQFMITTGKRLFKGYEEYDELKRFSFDLETEGLDPTRHMISQIGMRTNKGLERIYSVEGDTRQEQMNSEIEGLKCFLRTIKEEEPDVIMGYNSEIFDWEFEMVRAAKDGYDFSELSQNILGTKIYKKKRKTALKLGGEVEYYNQTIIPTYNVIDTMHAVRRAQAIDSSIKKHDLKYITKYCKQNKKNRVYVPGDKIRQTWLDTEPSYAHNDTDGSWYKISDSSPLKEGYEAVTGRYIVERYLLDDLYETDKVDIVYNQANFLLCKMLPVTFPKACTMGTAAIWQRLMLSWSYENNLAIPAFAEKRKFTGGLSRLLILGFMDKVSKMDFNSLYPSIVLTWLIKTALDISDVMLPLLGHILTGREKFKGLKKKAGKDADKYSELLKNPNLTKEEREEYETKLVQAKRDKESNDRKQLVFKVVGNSFFGSYGAQDVFSWGDTDCAEKTTCIGRQAFRLLMKWFKDKGYKPIVGDTDGINMQQPKNPEFDEHEYVSKGLGRNYEKGKTYKGVFADVAEFEDLFLRGKMGLDQDEFCPATINFGRKQYADLLEGGDIKLVGNTIKSKKMPVYIEKFLDKAILLLLNGKGQEFIEEYYSYIEKIYNYQIPLRDIATKGKIKRTLDQYLADMKVVTKAGRTKSRQAWYELALRDNLKIDMGDTIYYINTGTKKSHSDLKKISRYFGYPQKEKTLFDDLEEKKVVEITNEIDKNFKKYKKDHGLDRNYTKAEYIASFYPNAEKREEIQLSCVRLDNSVVEAENDTFCGDGFEYNVEKYIDMFNKRIKCTLVCFDKSIRDQILITNPDDKKYFTKEQTMLVSGQPNKEGDQDRYEDVMTMEDKEIRFWKSIGEKPVYADECGMDWEEILKDYDTRMEKEKELGIEKIRDYYQSVIEKMTEEDYQKFVEDGKYPKGLDEIVELDPITNNFTSRKYPDIIIGNIYDIIDKTEFEEVEEDGEEKESGD